MNYLAAKFFLSMKINGEGIKRINGIAAGRLSLKRTKNLAKRKWKKQLLYVEFWWCAARKYDHRVKGGEFYEENLCSRFRVYWTSDRQHVCYQWLSSHGGGC